MAILRLLCLFNILIFILFYHASLEEAKELRDNSHKLINHAFSREIKNRVVSLVTVCGESKLVAFPNFCQVAATNENLWIIITV